MKALFSKLKNKTIFLAHANEDKPVVRKIYNELYKHGYTPWLDENDLVAGSNWKDSIKKQISISDIFIACFSKNSINKTGYVQHEFRLALNSLSERPAGSVYIIPLKLDDCEIPNISMYDLGISFNDLHWIEYWGKNANKKLILSLDKSIETNTNSSNVTELISLPTTPKYRVRKIYFLLFTVFIMLMTFYIYHSEKQTKTEYAETEGFRDFISLSKELKISKGGTPNDSYCNLYAKLAILHSERRVKKECGAYIKKYKDDKAKQWSFDLIGQYNWCMTVSTDATETEAIYRERRIKDCLIGL